MKKRSLLSARALHFCAFALAAVLLCGTLIASAFSAGNWARPLNDFSYLTDVGQGWAYNDIKWAVDNGIMTNMGDDAYFNPSVTLSRAMYVQILRALMNKIGVDVTVTKTTEFSDVPQGKWFYPAVQWAAENKIVSGMGDGIFAPNDNITREQLALILYNFISKYCKVDLSGYSVDLEATYTDAAEISGWARKAVSALSAMQMMYGKGSGTFVPRGNATRAEAAAMAHRLFNYYNSTPECYLLTGSALVPTFVQDFDGNEYDKSVWRYLDGRADFNQLILEPASLQEELRAQYGNDLDAFLSEHIYTDGNGNLVLRETKYGDGQAYSVIPAIDTTESFWQTYGYYEIRCKLPTASGTNTAFWMRSYQNGLRTAEEFAAHHNDPHYFNEYLTQLIEVDMFESYPGQRDSNGRSGQMTSTVWTHGRPGGSAEILPNGTWQWKTDENGTPYGPKNNDDRIVAQTYLYSRVPGAAPNTKLGAYLPLSTLDNEYHTYGMLWTKEGYSFFVDGYYYGTLTEGISDSPGNMLLQIMASDSEYFNDDKLGSLDLDDFPAEFIIDYVHVYQLKDYMQDYPPIYLNDAARP